MFVPLNSDATKKTSWWGGPCHDVHQPSTYCIAQMADPFETTSDVRCVRAFGYLRRYARKSTCTSLRSPSDHGQTPKKKKKKEKKKGGGVRRTWVNVLSPLWKLPSRCQCLPTAPPPPSQTGTHTGIITRRDLPSCSFTDRTLNTG
jgi:hypothetical protein